ncbi:MAG: helix-turn-helix domain-containing protein [Synechococcus sp.]
MRAAHLQPFVSFLEKNSIPTQPLLSKVDISDDNLACDRSWVLESKVWKFADRAARIEGIDSFGYWVGETIVFDNLSDLGRILTHCNTVLDAIRTFIKLAKYESNRADFSLSFSSSGYVYFIRHGIPSIDIGNDQIEDYVLQMMIRIVRLGAGENWFPSQVFLQKDKIPTAIRRSLESQAVEIFSNSKKTVIVFPEAVLFRNIPNKDRFKFSTDELHEKIRHLSNLEDVNSNIGAIQLIIREQMKYGTVSVEQTAHAAGLSARNLQRYLQSNDLTFTQLLNMAKYRKAHQLLTQTSLDLGEISNALGYTEQSHFSRAFKKWSGQNPNFYRQSKKENIEEAE